MRTILVIGGCLLSGLLSAQFVIGQSVEYTYDGAGNRILREPWDGQAQGQNPGLGGRVLQTDLTRQADRYNPEDLFGIEAAEKVSIYPNPTSDFLTLEFISTIAEEQPRKLILYSPTGALLFSKTIAADQNVLEVDLTAYSSGLYLIEIRSSTANRRYSIIKE